MPDRQLSIKSPQDFAGGIFLVVIGLIALIASWNLPLGTMRQMGPGMFPRSLSLITMLLGAILMFNALRYEGHGLERWSLRGILFILGGVVLFGLTVRGYPPLGIPPLGLIVSGPLVVVISGFASPETRWREIIPFGVVMTGFCILLFKFVLQQPIPLAPWWLGY
jgi:hypothetical protein